MNSIPNIKGKAIATHFNHVSSISPPTAHDLINKYWLFSLRINEWVGKSVRSVHFQNSSKILIFKTSGSSDRTLLLKSLNFSFKEEVAFLCTFGNFILRASTGAYWTPKVSKYLNFSVSCSLTTSGSTGILWRMVFTACVIIVKLVCSYTLERWLMLYWSFSFKLERSTISSAESIK